MTRCGGRPSPQAFPIHLARLVCRCIDKRLPHPAKLLGAARVNPLVPGMFARAAHLPRNIARRFPPPTAPPSARGRAARLRRRAPTLHIARPRPPASGPSRPVSCGCAGAYVRPARCRVSPASRRVNNSARQIILRYVTRDVGKLEGKAQITGTVQRVMVIGLHPHHHRHHHARRRPPHESNSGRDRPHCAGCHSAVSRAKPSMTSSAIDLGKATFARDNMPSAVEGTVRPWAFARPEHVAVRSRIVANRAHADHRPTPSPRHDPAHRPYHHICGTRRRAARRAHAWSRSKRLAGKARKTWTRARCFRGA